MKAIRKILLIEIGTLMYAIAVGVFILPGDVLSGGVAGIVTLINPYFSISEETLVIIISSVLSIIGFILLGREFTTNTIIHTISYPVMLLLVKEYIPSYPVDSFLASLYGGIIGGVGIGIIFRQGGSTGGMDVPPLIIEKYFKIKASKVIMLLDALTVLAGLYLHGLNSVLIGLICVYLTTFTMEKTISIYGGIEAKKFEIISDQYKEIADEIHSTLNRGSTIINAAGGYTNQEKKILMVVVSDEQSSDVSDIIQKYDKNAFVVVSETKDVNGEGFTYEPRI